MSDPRDVSVRKWEVTEYMFRNTAARDSFIDNNFPRRKTAQAPGMYILPDDSVLRVHHLAVSVEKPII